MALPKDVLLNILHHLRRCDLDWVVLVNRIMRGIVLANNKVLARRILEKATLYDPIRDGQASSGWRLAIAEPKKLKRRAMVRSIDGDYMELIGACERQIVWFLKALRHAHVKHLGRPSTLPLSRILPGSGV